MDVILDLLFGYPTEPVEVFVMFVSVAWGSACLLYPADLMDLVVGVDPVNPIPAYAWGGAMLGAGITKMIALLLPRWSTSRWLSSAVAAAWFASVPYSFQGIETEPLLVVTCWLLAVTAAMDAFRLHTIRRVRRSHDAKKGQTVETGDPVVRLAGALTLLLTFGASILHVAALHVAV